MTEHALMVANVGDSPWAFAAPKAIRVEGIHESGEIVLMFREHIRSEAQEIARFHADGTFDLDETDGYYKVMQTKGNGPITVSLVR